MSRRIAWTACALMLAVGFAAPAAAQDIASFEKGLSVETLDNGLTIMVYERPTAPVVSFFTHVDIGSAQEVPGITGLAHMFEHMAFKGTTKIGTKNYKAEEKALQAVDNAYYALDLEMYKKGGPDPEKLEELKKAFVDAQEEAAKHVQPNEFDELISRAGGVGLNAFTNTDTTGYFYSLPANKTELWAYLESERFIDPVQREFYKERDVVQEERRMRTESNPIGRLIEQFTMVAFQAHPYKAPVVGYMSDLKRFTRQDAEDFFAQHYIPSNITVSVVGDVKASEMMPMLRKYFGRMEGRPESAGLRTVEPQALAEKSFKIYDPSQPVYLEGYHRPAADHPDDAVYNAIADILSTGRTSRLYRTLVEESKIAAQSGAFNGFPGTKYPHLMLFFGVPSPGHENEEIQAVIREEIERLKSEPVTDDELKRVKTRAKAGLVRGLNSNQGIAIQIATYQGQYGDWRELFNSVDKIEAVTKDDIMRVAKEAFIPRNRTVGMIVTDEQEATN